MRYTCLLSLIVLFCGHGMSGEPPAPRYAQWPVDASGRLTVPEDSAPGLVIRVDGQAAASEAPKAFSCLEDALKEVEKLRASGKWPTGGIRIELEPGIYSVNGSVALSASMGGEPGAPGLLRR